MFNTSQLVYDFIIKVEIEIVKSRYRLFLI